MELPLNIIIMSNKNNFEKLVNLFYDNGCINSAFSDRYELINYHIGINTFKCNFILGKMKNDTFIMYTSGSYPTINGDTLLRKFKLSKLL